MELIGGLASPPERPAHGLEAVVDRVEVAVGNSDRIVD